MRNTARMQRDLSLNYIFPAHKIAVYIIQYFITVNIAMVIWRRDGQRMVVKLARNEGAEHKVITLKSLMDRRRLM